MVLPSIAAATLAALAAPQEPAPPPNFVVIFADDLGYGDLGSFGSPTIRTPRLDRMAAEGVKLTQFYSAANVCTPSRAALLTGRLPVRSGMAGDRRRVLFPDSTEGLPAEELTVAEALREEGYATACVGKWHLGHLPAYLPTAHGFDSYFGIPYSNDMDAVWPLPDGSNRFMNPQSKNFRVPLLRDTVEIERPADQATITRRYTEESVRFIREHRDEPFFLYLAHSLPHVPLFRGKAFEGVSQRGLYGDVVEEIDWSVGEVLDALRDEGLDERTVVIFTSDNGPWISHGDQGGSAGPLREGKGCTFEGGMRVPAIVRWPTHLPAGTTATGLASTLDLLPTLVSLSGGELPGDLVHDGFDLTAFLQGSAPSPRMSMAFYQGTELMAYRKGPYKAHFASHISYVRAPRIEHDPPLLYHLDRDPSEIRNLAEKHPDVVAELTEEAMALVKSTPPARSRLTAFAKKSQPAAESTDDAAHRAEDSADSPKRPNVVFLFADDLGPGEIHALNPERSRVPTPHIDSLVATGLRFTDAHTTSSVCTPSRYSLLTGRYAWRTSLQKGVTVGDAPPLIAKDRLTLGALFKAQGYSTAIVGKWHLNYGYSSSDPSPAPAPERTKTLRPTAYPVGTTIVEGPLTRGFDSFYGFHHAREMSSMVRDDRIVEELEVEAILPALVDSATAYIAGRAEEEDPFFLYVPLSAPHTPIVPTEPWIGKSGIGRYGDFVAQTDGAVGAILEALETHGFTEDTVVIFTSDNGTSRAAKIKQLEEQGHFPSGPYRGSKADLWEGGHRVPFLVRWPGKTTAKAEAPGLISLVDVLATFADWFDAPVPKTMGEDSLSFLPLLTDPGSAAPRSTLVHHSISGHFGIRRGHWKLLLAPGSAGWSSPNNAAARKAGLPELQLYRLDTDPGETTNLWDARPDLVAELTAELEVMVANGRTTPGPKQENDAPIDIWKRP